MRRSTLIAVAALSLVALASACATSPDEGLGNTVEDTKSVEPTPEAGANTTTLPAKPASTPDSGATAADSATPDSGSTTSSSGSSGTSGSAGSSGSSGSSGSTSSSSSSSSSGSSGAVGPACNTSDPLKLILYQLEVSNQSSPVPCPCAASECCYLGVTCVAP